MKFQIPNMHHSEVNGRTNTQTDRHTDKPKAICPSNFFKVGGIITSFSKPNTCIFSTKTSYKEFKYM